MLSEKIDKETFLQNLQAAYDESLFPDKKDPFFLPLYNELLDVFNRGDTRGKTALTMEGIETVVNGVCDHLKDKSLLVGNHPPATQEKYAAAIRKFVSTAFYASPKITAGATDAEIPPDTHDNRKANRTAFLGRLMEGVYPSTPSSPLKTGGAMMLLGAARASLLQQHGNAYAWRDINDTIVTAYSNMVNSEGSQEFPITGDDIKSVLHHARAAFDATATSPEIPDPRATLKMPPPEPPFVE